MTVLLLFAFIFGTLIGSFLNVVVLRYGSLRLSSTRSMCFSCGKTLHWYELVPVLSFFVQRGRCRGCRGKISWQYPLVELLTGCVFAVVFWKYLPLLSLFSYSVILSLVIQLSIWALLIAIAVYDLRHKIIPDALVYTSALLSFLYLLLTPNSQLTTLNFFGGPLLALPFAALWLFSRGRAMGLGDAKLILFFPWFVGFVHALSAVLIGFWLGAAVALALLLLKGIAAAAPASLCPTLKSKLRRLTMKSELPLAPFLILGLLIVYLFSIDVTGLSLLLQ